MKLRLDCRDVSRLLSRRQDTTPAPAERARMRLHLVMCEDCRNVEQQFDFLRRAMRGLIADDRVAAPKRTADPPP